MAAERPRLRAAAVGCVLAATVLWTGLSHRRLPHLGHAGFFNLYTLAMTALACVCMALALPPARRRPDEPAPAAAVLAVIPSYQEQDAAVHAAVRSILAQEHPGTVRVVVVDDGSTVPLTGFDHPDVTWLRTPNRGKRHAQAAALRATDLAAGHDFVLTVDSDSVLAPGALARLLDAMRDPRVQAATGTILAANRDENLLTRAVDVNLFLTSLVVRALPSRLGIVNPTSGAMSLYRTPVITDNLEDYLTSGTVGDDRRLCEYALLRGRTVSVPDAYVDTAMPATVRGTFRQRRRWGASSWRSMSWELVHLPAPAAAMRVVQLCRLTLLPLVCATLVAAATRAVHGTDPGTALAAFGICAAAELLVYALLRPGLRPHQRLLTPLLLPVLTALMLLVIYPAHYWALTHLRTTGWLTRQPAAAPPASADTASQPTA
ncbi:glycosyltransferase family 2 protein [Kitasatospora fiedleri]|nr:glycosyltransferase family 2 protein [Kitasatospora fiedleri]